MDALIGMFEMGKYGGYIWPSYAIAAAVLAGLAWLSRRALREREVEVAALEASRPPRTGRGKTGL